MPNFKISGLDVPKVKKMSSLLSKELANVIECPVDWVTFSTDCLSNGNIFCDGKLLEDTVFIHVEWFDRGRDVKNKVAKIITEGIMDKRQTEFSKIETVDIIFVDLDKSNYYENGEHF